MCLQKGVGEGEIFGLESIGTSRGCASTCSEGTERDPDLPDLEINIFCCSSDNCNGSGKATSNFMQLAIMSLMALCWLYI